MMVRLSRRRFLSRIAGAVALTARPSAQHSASARSERDPPVDDIIGRIRVTFAAAGDTLLDMARSNNLGLLELMAANPGLDPWRPGDGTPVTLPTAFILPAAARSGIVINLAELRLYYFAGKRAPVQSWPIGVGREYFTTPLGTTRIVRMQENPTWVPTASTRADRPELPAAVPPGPDNPLGHLALYLGWPSYAVHGTNQPWGVGRRVSRGCIRLYPEDITELYRQVKVGMPVTVVDQLAKLGWRDGELYLEAHTNKTQLDDLESTNRFTPEPIPSLRDDIIAAAGAEVDRLDWLLITKAQRERRGYPLRITRDVAGWPLPSLDVPQLDLE